MNRLLLDALAGSNGAARPPVWLMRQAGRHLPEYRALRDKHDFLAMCRTPELAAEVTLQPVRRYGVDAAIVFSDILVTADALGLGLRFEEGKGPIIEKAVRTAKDVSALPDIAAAETLHYVAETIALLKKELTVPLIGFAGAPFTVASYMIEGGTSTTFRNTKKWLYNDPDTFHALLEKIAELTIDYLNMQVDAGADAVQLFDTWAHSLSWNAFKEVSLRYMKRIADAIAARGVPVILFCRGSGAFAPLLAEAAPAAVSVDWTCSLSALRQIIPADIALQGNLDPDALYAPRAALQREVNALLKEMEGSSNYIFNLGHGIAPDVSPEAVATLVETVKAFEPLCTTK